MITITLIKNWYHNLDGSILRPWLTYFIFGLLTPFFFVLGLCFDLLYWILFCILNKTTFAKLKDFFEEVES